MDVIQFPLDNMPLKSLRVFIAAVDSGSFSETARQLRISVSSVSKQIGFLEENLGFALLYRTTRTVSVTKAGRDFYNQCLSIIDLVNKATATRDAGHIRIAVPPSIMSALLTSNINIFLSKYPEVTVDFFVTSSLPDIIKQRIDIAFVLREWPGVKMSNKKIRMMERVLCASPDYLAEHGVPSHYKELRNHPCLMSLLAGEPEQWATLSDGKKRFLPVKPVLSSDNGDMIRQVCITGGGIANLYRFHAQPNLDDGTLVQILPDIEIEQVGLYAIMPHRAMVNPAADAFLEFFESLLP